MHYLLKFYYNNYKSNYYSLLLFTAVSALMKTNPTNKEMKELAKEMAHSKKEQSKYNKILRN